MLSRSHRIAMSIVCLAVFCVLAAGSMDNSSSSAPSNSSAPADPPPSPKNEVMNAQKFTYRWSTDGTIMMLNFKIDNPTDHAFKDFEITCNHFAASGTKIDSNTRTIYEVVKAHGKKSMNEFNMGFIHSQAKSSNCKITDLTIIE